MTVTRLDWRGTKPRPVLVAAPGLRPENEAVVLMAADIHRAHATLNHLRVYRYEVSTREVGNPALVAATDRRIALAARRLDALCDAMRALAREA